MELQIWLKRMKWWENIYKKKSRSTIDYILLLLPIKIRKKHKTENQNHQMEEQAKLCYIQLTSTQDANMYDECIHNISECIFLTLAELNWAELIVNKKYRNKKWFHDVERRVIGFFVYFFFFCFIFFSSFLTGLTEISDKQK